jgi:hypothetical protein
VILVTGATNHVGALSSPGRHPSADDMVTMVGRQAARLADALAELEDALASTLLPPAPERGGRPALRVRLLISADAYLNKLASDTNRCCVRLA